ncbi:MAG: hypothetical protein JSU68_11380 [Phycisphaerales bacterium]|nr:MAG: hypothetical protein JSU68_11380 [Phycisphaerales bacterium]
MRAGLYVGCGLLVCLVTGCALQEVRSKTKAGPEFRYSSGSRTNENRWTVEQGFELRWDRGITTGVTYRRRDVDRGGGDHDDAVWLDFSFPIWKAPKKPDPTARRVEILEERLAELEHRLAEQQPIQEQERAGM